MTQAGFFYIKARYPRSSLSNWRLINPRSEPWHPTRPNRQSPRRSPAILRPPRENQNGILHIHTPPSPTSPSNEPNLTVQKFHGFSPLFTELSTGIGPNDIIQDQACYSEAFNIGHEIAGDSTKNPGTSLPLDLFNLYCDNQWPSKEAGFRGGGGGGAF